MLGHAVSLGGTSKLPLFELLLQPRFLDVFCSDAQRHALLGKILSLPMHTLQSWVVPRDVTQGIDARTAKNAIDTARWLLRAPLYQRPDYLCLDL